MLPSDFALTTTAQRREILADVAVSKIFEDLGAHFKQMVSMKVEGNDPGNVWPPQGSKRASNAFKAFSIKISKLTEASMRH